MYGLDIFLEISRRCVVISLTTWGYEGVAWCSETEIDMHTEVFQEQRNRHERGQTHAKDKTEASVIEL